MSEQLSLIAAVTERDRIIAHLAANHASYLESLREFAVAHALECGRVSIDDVRDTIERTGYPMPHEVGIDERVFGALFTRKRFQAVGTQPTRREAFAARVGMARSQITVYALRAAA
jgi:hypothetical protein